MNISESISKAYTTVITEHMKAFKPAHDAIHRSWLESEYPHLIRSRNLNRILFDMSVCSGRNRLGTGICLPIALFVQSYIMDIHSTEVELIGLWQQDERSSWAGIELPDIFCHCVIKHEDQYHDVYWPEGTDLKNILYSDKCITKSVDPVIINYRKHVGCQFLVENLFENAKNSLYTESDHAENYYNYCLPSS
jgi:hypothetical protein